MRKIKILSLCISAATVGMYLPCAGTEPRHKRKKKFASSATEEVVVTARKKEEDFK